MVKSCFQGTSASLHSRRLLPEEAVSHCQHDCSSGNQASGNRRAIMFCRVHLPRLMYDGKGYLHKKRIFLVLWTCLNLFRHQANAHHLSLTASGFQS